ncbi:MAG: hypothetical protein WC775_03335 [Patescibacteria group bacterium]|jgi:hypothetical protein
MNKKNTKLLIGIGVAVAVIILVSVVFLLTQQKKTTADSDESTLPQNEVLQKVEDSVSVSVDKGSDGRRVNFEVENIPGKYTTIEYEFSYLTGSGRLQGGNSSPSKIKGGSYSKEILLGTCSAGGACTYDDGVEAIKFSIIFTSGGERRVFEKDFSL